jgi:threonine dehydrogenase-like Zn-dependent dehydrogenase
VTTVTVQTGKTHVHRYLGPLLDRIEREEIDPNTVITHRMRLEGAPEGFEMFLHKRDNWEKVALSA